MYPGHGNFSPNARQSDMSDLPANRVKNQVKNQPRDRTGKWTKKPGFFTRLRQVANGTARRKIRRYHRQEGKLQNRMYQDGIAAIPRAKKTRKTRRRKPSGYIPNYRKEVVHDLVARLKFW